jgi:hypothetical protein
VADCVAFACVAGTASAAAASVSATILFIEFLSLGSDCVPSLDD